MGGASEDDVGSLSAEAFIARVERRLEGDGWTTSAYEVPFGAVVEATRDGRTRLAVVVPDGSATIPPELIERVVELRKRVGAEEVALTTRGTYAETARQRADEAAIELLDPATAVGAGGDPGLAARARAALGGVGLPAVGSPLQALRNRGADALGGPESGGGGDTVEETGGGDGETDPDRADEETDEATDRTDEAAGGTDAPAASGTDDSRLPVSLSRREALAGGAVAAVATAAGAGVVATQTGLLGGPSGPPVPPDAERVDAGSDAAERVRSSEGLQFARPDDAAVSVFTLGAGTAPEAVSRWYRTHATVNGWERALATAEAFVYRRSDRGVVVVVQERNALVDTGLPVEGDPPTDILLVGMEWGYLAPVADGLPVYPDATYTELPAGAAERVRTTDVLAFERPDDTTVMVYTAADAGASAVRDWYAADARARTGGWQRQATTDRGAVYRKGDRGVVVVVQERNALVDTGLPVEGDPPTDVLVLEMGWGTLAPLVG